MDGRSVFRRGVSGAWGQPGRNSALEKACGQELHRDHRVFLERCGPEPGLPLFGWNTNARAVTRVYRKNNPDVPSQFTLVGAADEEPFVDLYLERNPASASGYFLTSFESVDFSLPGWERSVSRTAASFSELVFSAGFATLRRRMSFGGRFGRMHLDEPAIPPEQVRQLLKKIGFTVHPARWPMHEYAFAADAACEILYWGPSVQVRLLAKTETNYKRMGQMLIDNLKLQRSTSF